MKLLDEDIAPIPFPRLCPPTNTTRYAAARTFGLLLSKLIEHYWRNFYYFLADFEDSLKEIVFMPSRDSFK